VADDRAGGYVCEFAWRGGWGEGEGWGGQGVDVKVPSANWFQYVRDEGAKHGGILLRSTRIFRDTAPVMRAMVQRGMVTKEDLGF